MVDSRELGVMLTKHKAGKTKIVDVNKVGLGVFHTTGESWLNSIVVDFIESTRKSVAVDPFAGSGEMLKLVKLKLGMRTYGYDIQGKFGWTVNDSMLSIPISLDSICITNPPFLAKYSAKRKALWPLVGHYFDSFGVLDLYELALKRCLESFEEVVAILPETFLHSKYSKKRCKKIIILENNPFEDTTFPVCVTCWGRDVESNPTIYKNEKRVMKFLDMINMKKRSKSSHRIRFNDPRGNIGMRAVDGVIPEVRVGFLPAGQFSYPTNCVKQSSRLMTYINVPRLETQGDIELFCQKANEILNHYRTQTDDVILSGFKGNNNAGVRRRRLDYNLARKICENVLDAHF